MTRNGDGDGGPPGGAGLRGLKVLLVEDEALIAFDLEGMLRELGCAVVFVAPSGKEALAVLRAERPDMALLDLRLPDGRVTPVAQALATAGVPFAVVSGYGPGWAEEPVLRAAPCLAKPYGRAAVREALTRLAAAAPSPPAASAA